MAVKPRKQRLGFFALIAVLLGGGFLCLVMSCFVAVAIFVGALVHGVPDGSSGVSSVPVSVGRLTASAVPRYQAEFQNALDTQCARLPPQVFAALIWQESGWDKDATNPSGADGLGQLMPDSQRAYGVDADGGGFDPFSAADNLATSARVFCRKMDVLEVPLSQGRIKGDLVALALSAYNGGEGNVLKSGGIYPPTAGYVREILARAQTFVVPLSGNDLDVPSGVVTIDGSTGKGCPPGGTKFTDDTKSFGLIGLCDMGDYTTNANLAPALVKLFVDARAQGIPLTVTSSYRPYSVQQLTYARNCPGGVCRVPTAVPGTSQHELGLAIDFGCAGRGMTRDSVCFRWLTSTGGGPGTPAGSTNAYGLRNFSKEPWHFSPSGR